MDRQATRPTQFARRRMCLVCMPFASISHAALGVSLVQAVARSVGFPCDLYYFNLKLAGELGFDVYNTLGELSPPAALVGDWVFSHCVDAGIVDRAGDYFEKTLFGDFESYFTLDVAAEVLRLRNRADAFLDECLEKVRWDEYALIGFTTSFQQNCASLGLARKIKERFPTVQIVFGGANCEGEMGLALHRSYTFIDYVVSGEAESVLPRVLEAIRCGEPVPSIPGVIIRRNGITLRPEQLVMPVLNMDDLPVPDLSEYFRQLEQARLDTVFEPLVPFETARGCWWGAKKHCTFCGLNGHTMLFRSKSPARALAELQTQRQWGRRFLVVDNILDYRYFDTFLTEIARKHIDVSLHYEIKANVQQWQVGVLRDAGVDHVQPGIESLSTSVLRLMRKGTTRLQNIYTLRLFKEARIDVAWNLLYGFPGEDPSEYEEMAKLLPLLHHLDAPGFCGPVRVDRHSPYFMDPKEFGLRNLRPKQAYSCVYRLAPVDLLDVAYYFDFDFDWTDDPGAYTASLMRAFGAWRLASDPSLTVQFLKEGAVVQDTRNGLDKVRMEIDGVRSAVLAACQRMQSVEAIQAAVADCKGLFGVTKAEIYTALDELACKGLIVSEDKKFLALPIFPWTQRDSAGKPAHEGFVHPIRQIVNAAVAESLLANRS